MDRIACRCGWSVNVGMDCDFCGIRAEDVIEHARLAAELREVTELSAVPELRLV